MKPGGRIFAAVPFLQPYHGYPDHYYNMTAAGLRNLFADLEVERLDVPGLGAPDLRAHLDAQVVAEPGCRRRRQARSNGCASPNWPSIR